MYSNRGISIVIIISIVSLDYSSCPDHRKGLWNREIEGVYQGAYSVSLHACHYASPGMSAVTKPLSNGSKASVQPISILRYGESKTSGLPEVLASSTKRYVDSDPFCNFCFIWRHWSEVWRAASHLVPPREGQNLQPSTAVKQILPTASVEEVPLQQTQFNSLFQRRLKKNVFLSRVGAWLFGIR